MTALGTSRRQALASPVRRSLLVALSVVLVVLIAHLAAATPVTFAALAMTTIAAIGAALLGEADRRWNPGSTLPGRSGGPSGSRSRRGGYAHVA